MGVAGVGLRVVLRESQDDIVAVEALKRICGARSVRKFDRVTASSFFGEFEAIL